MRGIASGAARHSYDNVRRASWLALLAGAGTAEAGVISIEDAQAAALFALKAKLTPSDKSGLPSELDDKLFRCVLGVETWSDQFAARGDELTATLQIMSTPEYQMC